MVFLRTEGGFHADHPPLGFEVDQAIPTSAFPTCLPTCPPSTPLPRHLPTPRLCPALPPPSHHKHTELPWLQPGHLGLTYPRPQGHYNPSSILLDLGSDGCGYLMPSLLSRSPSSPLHSPTLPPPFPAHCGSGTLTPSSSSPGTKQPSSAPEDTTAPTLSKQPLVHVGSTFLSLATASSPGSPPSSPLLQNSPPACLLSSSHLMLVPDHLLFSHLNRVCLSLLEKCGGRGSFLILVPWPAQTGRYTIGAQSGCVQRCFMKNRVQQGLVHEQGSEAQEVVCG